MWADQAGQIKNGYGFPLSFSPDQCQSHHAVLKYRIVSSTRKKVLSIMRETSIRPLHDYRVEACRGFALLCMIIAHWPVGVISPWLTVWTGFVGPDEVFVLASGFLAGSFYGPLQESENKSAVWKIIFFRCLQIWSINLLRIILIEFIHAYRKLSFTGAQFNEVFPINYFLQNPARVILKFFSFQYQPDSLGLFPVFFVIYIVMPIFIIITKKSKIITVLISLCFYIIGQIFENSNSIDSETQKWFYNLLSWQFPFFIGLCFGYPRPFRRSILPYPHIIAAFMSIILILCFFAKFLTLIWPQLQASLSIFINHDNLGFLRLINLFAYFIVFARLLREESPFTETFFGKVAIICGQHPTTLFMIAIIIGLLIDFFVISVGIWYLPNIGAESLIITIPLAAALLNAILSNSLYKNGLYRTSF